MKSNKEDKLKVLHLGRFYPPTGGLEDHVMALLKALNPEIQADNLVAGSISPGSHALKEGFHVYSVKRWGILASTALAPTFPVRLHRLARDYDIVHLHLPDPLSVLSALLLPRNKPFVVSWHSDIVRQKFLLRFFQPFMNALLRRTRAVVAATPGHFSSSTQLKSFPDKNKHILTYGANPEEYRQTPEVKQSLAVWKAKLKGRSLVFALGRHVYYKGFEYLVQATSSLPEEAFVIIGGTGPLTDKYRSMAAELNLKDRIEFPGRLSDSDRLALLHLCDVFCMPSVEPAEAFGLVQRDAMFCGKPVVCCDLKNGVNYVNEHGKSGLVVPPRDPVALAEALNRLLSDPNLRKRMGTHGKKRATREFSDDAMVAQARAVYDLAIEGA